MKDSDTEIGANHFSFGRLLDTKLGQRRGFAIGLTDYRLDSDEFERLEAQLAILE